VTARARLHRDTTTSVETDATILSMADKCHSSESSLDLTVTQLARPANDAGVLPLPAAGEIVAQLNATTYALVQQRVVAVDGLRRSLAGSALLQGAESALRLREQLRSLAAKVRRAKELAAEIDGCARREGFVEPLTETRIRTPRARV
jgi:hypothetical protein